MIPCWGYLFPTHALQLFKSEVLKPLSSWVQNPSKTKSIILYVYNDINPTLMSHTNYIDYCDFENECWKMKVIINQW